MPVFPLHCIRALYTHTERAFTLVCIYPSLSWLRVCHYARRWIRLWRDVWFFVNLAMMMMILALIFIGFSLLVLYRRKWGLPGFRKSSQGKLVESGASSSSSSVAGSAASSGSNNNSSNNRLPPPFRKSQSDKRFKVTPCLLSFLIIYYLILAYLRRYRIYIYQYMFLHPFRPQCYENRNASKDRQQTMRAMGFLKMKKK